MKEDMVKKTEKQRHKEIFDDLRKYSFYLHKNKYPTYDLDSIQSEIMFKFANKLDYLYDMKYGDRSDTYRGYLKTTVERLIYKYVAEERVKNIVSVPFASDDNNADFFDSNNSVLTPYVLDILLNNKDESIFSYAEKVLTPLQYDTLCKVYLDKVNPNDLAVEQNVSVQAIIDRLNKSTNALILRV